MPWYSWVALAFILVLVIGTGVAALLSMLLTPTSDDHGHQSHSASKGIDG